MRWDVKTMGDVTCLSKNLSFRHTVGSIYTAMPGKYGTVGKRRLRRSIVEKAALTGILFLKGVDFSLLRVVYSSCD